MPTIGTMRLPPPQDGIEFQDMVLAALRQRWSSPELERHGRQGQAQQSVDLYGPDNLGRMVGVQCKAVKKLTISEISEEVTKAEAFEPAITALYITTTLLTDANLQKEVRLISEKRIKESKFPVGIIFWESIKDDLAADRSILQRFYPDLALTTPSMRERDGSRMLSTLDIGFCGTTLRYRMRLALGSIGMPPADSYTISRVVLQIEACGNVLFEDSVRSEFSRSSHDLLADALRIALGQASSEEYWDKVEPLATQIEAYVSSLDNVLRGEELAAYTCGRLLGLWAQSETEDRRLPAGLLDQLLSAVDVLKPTTELKESIRARAKEFEENRSVTTVHNPSLVYGEIRKLLHSRAFDQ